MSYYWAYLIIYQHSDTAFVSEMHRPAPTIWLAFAAALARVAGCLNGEHWSQKK